MPAPPSLDVARRRNRERSIWTVDEALLTELHEMLEGNYTRHWLIVNNSDGLPEDAAAAIARSLGLAIRARE